MQVTFSNLNFQKYLRFIGGFLILGGLSSLLIAGFAGFGRDQLILIIDGTSFFFIVSVAQTSEHHRAYWIAVFLTLLLTICWAVVHQPSTYAFVTLLLVFVFVTIAFASFCKLVSAPPGRRFLLFSHLLLLFVCVCIPVMVELLSGLVVPSWPARELRPVKTKKVYHDTNSFYNSWGLRDGAREIKKKTGTKRVVFIGDSFLEGGFVSKTLSQFIEAELDRMGVRNIECVNLGVSATGPPHYLQRLRNIAFKLSPDMILIFFYSGNDYVSVPYQRQDVPFIAERPLPSVLGNFMPRFTWLIVNRFGLTDVTRQKDPQEMLRLKAISEMQYEEGLDALSHYMHEYYYPDLSESAIRKILSRGGQSFWDTFKPRQHDREYFQGTWLQALIYITLHLPQLQNMNVEYDPNVVKATESYLVEMSRELRIRGVAYHMFLIPNAVDVDPTWFEFWRPWFKTELANWQRQRQMRAVLHSGLQRQGIETTDLYETLKGVQGAYRKSDGHWTEKGHVMVADTVSRIIKNKLPN